MRSPGCSVGYIDVDGMKKVWKTNALTSTATKTAATMMTPHSITHRRVLWPACCGELFDRRAGGVAGGEPSGAAGGERSDVTGAEG